MEPFNQLLGQYNFGDVVIIIILVLMCAKSLGEALSWAYKAIKGKFRKDSETEQIIDEHETIEQKINTLSDNVNALCESVQSIQDEIHSLSKKQDSLQKKILDMESSQADIQEQFLYSARVFIIDKYHYHCYVVHQIDEITMDSLENRYATYKSHGGNSFIDGLMDRLRALPLVKTSDEPVLYDTERKRLNEPRIEDLHD